jgi:hypothetical protein
LAALRAARWIPTRRLFSFSASQSRFLYELGFNDDEYESKGELLTAPDISLQTLVQPAVAPVGLLLIP